MTKRKMIAIISMLLISGVLLSSCSAKSTETTTLQESMPYSTPSAKESVLEEPTQEMESPSVSFKQSVYQEPAPSPLSSTETVNSESHFCGMDDRDYGEWYIRCMQSITNNLYSNFGRLKCSGNGLRTSGLESDPLTGSALVVADIFDDGEMLFMVWELGTEKFSLKESVENGYEFVLCYRALGDEYFRASVISLVSGTTAGGTCIFRMDGTTALKEICAMQKQDQESTKFDMLLFVVDKEAGYENISFPNPEEGELPIAQGRVVCWDEGAIFCKNAAFEVLNSWT